jgi:nitrile hydratase alpha subunit
MSEHTHDHGHDHEHPHPNQPDIDAEPMGYYQVMGSALGELLIEKAVITADELRSAIEDVDSRSPEGGATVVAKAWTDPDYKSRLLENGTAAVDELGIDMPATHLVVVENTEKVHNVIVCTLCSCYPRMLLGLPPDWYKANAYRSRVVREPRAVLKEFGTELADDVEIRVHDSTADMRYLVLPRRPEGTEGMTEQELVEVVNRDSMIGVTVPKAP